MDVTVALLFVARCSTLNSHTRTIDPFGLIERLTVLPFSSAHFPSYSFRIWLYPSYSIFTGWLYYAIHATLVGRFAVYVLHVTRSFARSPYHITTARITVVALFWLFYRFPVARLITHAFVVVYLRTRLRVDVRCRTLFRVTVVAHPVLRSVDLLYSPAHAALLRMHHHRFSYYRTAFTTCRFTAYRVLRALRAHRTHLVVITHRAVRWLRLLHHTFVLFPVSHAFALRLVGLRYVYAFTFCCAVADVLPAFCCVRRSDWTLILSSIIDYSVDC